MFHNFGNDSGKTYSVSRTNSSSTVETFELETVFYQL